MASGFEVAIIGLAGRFPGARTVDEFWRNLVSGVESISRFTDEEVIAAGIDPALVRDPAYVKAGGVLDDVERFDSAFFGYTPREAEVMDPQQRIFLECAWEAIEDAGYDTERYRRPVGVFAGMSMNTYVFSNLIFNTEAVEALGEAQAAIANLHDHLATRVSYKLDLRGPSFTVQTACSTSLVAVHLACQSLISGECDMAIAGGVSVSLPQKGGYLYTEGGIHSPDGRCRAFDASAQGMVGGSGVGAVVLKRLDDALADGDRIVAVVKGSAINNDGASKVGYTAPSVDGEARVIRSALRAADVEPATVGYVEAHGTGTAIGDPIEIEALARVFRGKAAGPGTCGVGSVKTNVGHLDAAAGMAGLIKAALALEHGQIPPTLHFERPNPHIDFASTPFFVVDRLREWPRAVTPRRAGVSGFGIGGTNAHVVLEEAPAPNRARETSEPHAYVLSARTPSALDAAAERLAANLEAHGGASHADVAWTLQTGRRQFPARAAVVAESVAGAAGALRAGLKARTGTVVRRDEPLVAKTAFLVPGQGAQYPGMARELYARFAPFRDAMDQVAAAMLPALDVRALIADTSAGAAERLRQTEYAQPALFAVEYATARLLEAIGVTPDALLGHSVGEYVAACLAGVFTVEDAAALVALRGRLMSEAPAGAMLAIAATEPDARGWGDGSGLSLAAVNGPSACVLAGTFDAIEALERRLSADGIGCSRLHTSHAFHSHLMDGIVERFRDAVAARPRHAPAKPFVSNVTGTWITEAQAIDPGYWARHLREPVRFADGVATLAATCGRFVEVGPGATLTTLARQTAKHVAGIAALPKPDASEPADVTFLSAVARLWTEGVAIDWAPLHDRARRRRVALPTYPFERQRHWVERTGAHPAVAARRAGNGPMLYVPSWRRDPAGTVDAIEALTHAKRQWLVFLDETGLGRAIAARLERAGQRVVTADTAALATAAGCDALLARLSRDRQVPDAIVFCATAPAGTPGEARRTLFEPLVTLAQAMERQRLFAPVQLTIVSTGLYDIVGSESIEPLRALALGPVRVIPQEMPNVRTRNLDVDGDVERAADAVVRELAREIDDQTVAIRNGRRWTLKYDAADEAALRTRSPLDVATGAAVVFGGFGNIGSVAARALVAAGWRSVVLASRHAAKDRPIVRELEAAGATVVAAECDLETATAVGDVLTAARDRFGRVAIVVHAAGPSGDAAVASIADTAPAHVDRQFGSKVAGLLAMADAIDAHRPGRVVLVSSLSSILGGLGFTAYAAANAAMDAVAEARARDGRWTAIDWDGWRFDGAATPGAIDAATGQRVFELVLTRDIGPRLVVTASPLEPRLAQWINPGARESAPADRRVAGQAAARAIVHPTNDVERIVVRAWRDLLGIEEIGLDDNFFDLGGHSLLATQLVGRLRRTLLVDLPLKDLFERPTVRDVAATVVSHESAPGQAMATARVRLQLAGMSPEEMRAMLAAKRAETA